MLKIFKKQLMTKDFLWRLKLHVGNWNEWPLVLRTWFSVLSGGRSRWRQWLDDLVVRWLHLTKQILPNLWTSFENQ